MKASIYCGLRAIGWVVHNEKEIVQYGIKRLSVPFDNYYEFIAGLPITARINRRLKRQARRNKWRNKSRRNSLKNYLNYEYKVGSTRAETLQLRVKGLTQRLSNKELAKVLMSLQNKRGYKSLRGVSDNENSEYLQTIEKHENNLKKYRSIAEYLLTFDSSKNIIFMRQSYINEFNAIMDKQEVSDEFRKKTYGLLYYQNPLKKGYISKCKYETNRRVIHASHPLYQEFRIWRDVMNIIIWDKQDNQVDISYELRKKWAEKLNKGTKITKSNCIKDLGLKKPTQYQWLSGKSIAPNPLSVFDKIDIKVNKEQLWQELYSATEDEKLKIFLKHKYNFSSFTIDQLADLDFNSLGWADISAKSIRKLLPLLKLGTKQKTAVLEVYGKVDFKNVEVRNWMVEKHFFAYKSLVEKLKSKYKIEQVKFEIDYQLKSSAKSRKSNQKQKRAEIKLSKKNPTLTKYDLLKLKLWNESEGYSPYVSTKIPIEELYTDKYNIDHIVPKSKLFQSGFSNMVLSPTGLNDKKGNKYTGIEFAEKLDLIEHYKGFINKVPSGKQKHLRMRTQDIPRGEISARQNSDYNTKCFATIGDALNIPNKLITRYLKQWDVNNYNEQDARYYLQKAWVLANFDQQTIDYFDNIQDVQENPYGLKNNLQKINFENPPIFLQKIKFTRKTKHGYMPRFNLHKETIYGERIQKLRNDRGEWIENVFYKIRQPIEKLTTNMVKNIMDKTIKDAVKKRINQKGSIEEAILSHSEKPICHNNKPIRAVSVRINGCHLIPLHSTDANGSTGAKGVHLFKTDFVYPDKYFCLILKSDKKGRITKESIPLIDFVDGINKGRVENIGFTLQENDLIKIDDKVFYCIGSATDTKIRPVYTLSATNQEMLNKGKINKLEKLFINQLGEIIKTKKINVNS